MKSDSIAKLAEALSKFQGEVGKTIFDSEVKYKDKQGRQFNFKYATLTALVETAKKPLSANNLALSQLVETDENASITVTTILMHSSGEWLDNALTMRPEKTTPQGLGSVITYARRYSYAAILGLVSDSDDDANEGKSLNNQTTPKQTNNKTPTKTTQIKEKGNITQILNVIDVVQDDAALDKIKSQIPAREWSDEEIVKINNAIAKRRKTIISDSEIPF